VDAGQNIFRIYYFIIKFLIFVTFLWIKFLLTTFNNNRFFNVFGFIFQMFIDFVSHNLFLGLLFKSQYSEFYNLNIITTFEFYNSKYKIIFFFHNLKVILKF